MKNDGMSTDPRTREWRMLVHHFWNVSHARRGAKKINLKLESVSVVLRNK